MVLMVQESDATWRLKEAEGGRERGYFMNCRRVNVKKDTGADSASCLSVHDREEGESALREGEGERRVCVCEGERAKHTLTRRLG